MILQIIKGTHRCISEYQCVFTCPVIDHDRSASSWGHIHVSKDIQAHTYGG